MIEILNYNNSYAQQVIDLVLNIQQQEFGIPVQLSDQPDLQNIEKFYGKGMGAFWVAIDSEKLVGSVGLLDFGNHEFALRKMFVRADYRGKDYSVATSLLNTAIRWCRQHQGTGIYLGTSAILKGAQRFYEKNGFDQMPADKLPPTFPRMNVDTLFYKLDLTKKN